VHDAALIGVPAWFITVPWHAASPQAGELA
jgi:hypothetical protein